MPVRYQFNRMELAGALGDLGVTLPLAVSLILLNGLDPVGVFISVGVYYIVSGIYFGVPAPVQPMKVIGAYALATGLGVEEITGAGLIIAVLLLILGLTGAMSIIGRITRAEVVRGVQLSTGVLLMLSGLQFMLGTSKFQATQGAAEPNLILQSIGPLPIGIVLGLGAALMVLLLLENRRFPGGLVVVLLGVLLGLVLGKELPGLSLGFHLPTWLPFGLPSGKALGAALLLLVLPQIPMTLGNAVLAYKDLSEQYFGPASSKVTAPAVCVSMALANFGAALVGGMPLCHGAGGLAAHYRFGARSAGCNMIIGGGFVLLAVLLGPGALSVAGLIPLSVLGALLIFAGGQLALTIMDLENKEEMFVSLTILVITLASNLAWGFGIGLALAWGMRWLKLKV
jgi:SulP family sulfate permease